MIFAHYGHNDGDDAVCSYDGLGEPILPSGDGMHAGMRWCPECRRVLKERGGRLLLDAQLDLFEDRVA